MASPRWLEWLIGGAIVVLVVAGGLALFGGSLIERLTADDGSPAPGVQGNPM